MNIYMVNIETGKISKKEGCYEYSLKCFYTYGMKAARKVKKLIQEGKTREALDRANESFYRSRRPK